MIKQQDCYSNKEKQKLAILIFYDLTYDLAPIHRYGFGKPWFAVRPASHVVANAPYTLDVPTADVRPRLHPYRTTQKIISLKNKQTSLY